MRKNRVFWIVLDSFGIGETPDAADFGDQGSNTLGAVRKSPFFSVPNLQRLGLFSIDGVSPASHCLSPHAAVFRAAEASKGKDTTVGHWELAGLVSGQPLPTFPQGFPSQWVKRFSSAVGRAILCNLPYSGTQVIADYGKQHQETGGLILYTSADSVCQIAAHEQVVPIEELYQICETARKMLTGPLGVGRVIARPFVGEEGRYVRTSNRRDFSLLPPGPTLLDVVSNAGKEVLAIGKIYDIFAGRGITRWVHTSGNQEGMEAVMRALSQFSSGLCFANLVDFDMLYGHRNDRDGYAKALSLFDNWLGDFLPELLPTDLLVISADHGCDPDTPSTDHSREYIPAIFYGKDILTGSYGTRDTFADVGKTIGDVLGISNALTGNSLACSIFREG